MFIFALITFMLIDSLFSVAIIFNEISFMQNQNIPISLQPDGVLAPCPLGGQGMANVVFSRDPSGGVSAIIAFNGMNQAVATFDETGSNLVSYMMYDPNNIQLQRSVENIIRHISRTH